MAIIDRQIQKRLEELLARELRMGRIPSGRALQTRMRKFMERVTGGPVFRPLAQAPGSYLDVRRFDDEMENLGLDLEVLYEEALAQTMAAIRRSGWEDSTYRANQWLLEKASTDLDAILVALKNADDHFLGVSDRMSDLTRVDLGASTPDVVDLSERAAAIPATALATKRLVMDHMLSGSAGRVRVLSPARVLSSRTAPDAALGNAFHDVGLVWRHDVEVKEGPVSLELTFPLRGDGEEERVTRVAYVATMESPATITVLYTRDDLNWIQLPGGSTATPTSASRQTAFDFPALGIRKLRFVMEKGTADEVRADGKRFTFALGSIAVYSLSRANQAVYQTKPLFPMDQQIENVAVEVTDRIPAGCAIDYYVADESGEFLPVSPIGRTSPDRPASVRFGSSRKVTRSFTGARTLRDTVNAIDFYSANAADPATGEPIFGTARLWRGAGCWARQTSPDRRVETVRDVFIDFRADDKQYLYRYSTESATGELRVDDAGEDVTILRTRRPVNYTPRTAGHLLVPPDGVDSRTDTQPKYAIAQVLAYRSAYDVTGEVVALGSNTAYFANRNIDHNVVVDDEVVRTLEVHGPTGAKLTEGTHYRLGKWAGTEYLDGSITKLRDDPDSGTGEVNVTVDYKILQDVTHLVRDVKNVNEVWFAHPITADRFEIRYRTVPSDVVRPSIVVTETFGDDDPGRIYREGSDYQIDTRTGQIVRMAGGGIASGVCYVDFQYLANANAIETFSTWCLLSSDQKDVPAYSRLGLDREAGEGFYLDTVGGRIDLTESTEFPPLAPGWHRFLVRSRPSSDAGSGIRKVLALVDRDGNPVFAGTRYFQRITAMKDPLVQVTETALMHQVRKSDHSSFALVDGVVVLNFPPGRSDDLLTLYYQKGSNSIVERDEQFDLEFLVPSSRTSRGVRLKAVLRRDPGADPGLTPKLFGWSIRVSR